jgi:hypothetical protein
VTSQPEYDVAAHVDRTVTTRDGVGLSTDVYRPADPETGEAVAEPKPALLVRTPYDKRDRTRVENYGRFYAERGYVVALQDVRGRYESEGEFTLLRNEPADGADAVEWLADRDYCDGQVGTLGTSYMAWVQNALATQRPEGLAAMFVNQGAANAWEATLRHNGAMELRWLTWALTIGGGFAKRALADPAIQQLLADVDTRELLVDGPVHRGQSPLRHVPNYEEWFFDLATTEGTDEMWDEPGLNFEAHYDRMADVPTVYAGSWYDSYGKATCDNYEALADRMESDHYLLMGAWTHGGQSTWTRTFAGDVDYGAAASRDFLRTALRFFDRYLKGRDTWADAPVQYVRLGVGDGSRTAAGRLAHGGEWADAEAWPLPGTEFTTYYAHGDGTLSTTAPTAAESRTTYAYDPDDPVPTIGGNCSSYYTFEPREESLETLALPDRPKRHMTGQGGYDQRTTPETVGADAPYGPLEERDDVVVFRTPPLPEAVEIAGPIRVSVYGSTDAPDTDFTAKLVDEYPPSETWPNGYALNLADSICRGRYRGYRREPDPLAPGTVHEFEMEPYPTANVFRPGHRIRLDVSSSNYPRYDANPNTGGPLYGDRDARVAHNAVHHEADSPTHVELPVQPADGD